MPDGRAAERVTIIGAGIVGVCVASYLQQEGFAVEIVDPEPPGTMCSYGNAGGICPGSCVPLAGPGMLKNLPRWLLDPEGPLHIRLAYLPRLAPWLVRFLAAGKVERVREISRHMRALHAQALELYAPLVRAAGCEDLISRRGQLFVHESACGPEKDAFGLALRRAAGVEVELLDRHEIRQLEPALAPIFARAVYLPEQGQTKNPGRLVAALAEHVVRRGGRLVRAAVTGVEMGACGPEALASTAGRLPVQRLVVAAGAWSGRLAASLGSKVPLETERGYHVVVTGADPGLRIQTMWAERKFVAAPMEDGLRLAGTVEFGGLAAEPDMARADLLLRQGRRMFPGLEVGEVSRWMGHRPSLPDSLPVISRSPHHENVLFAFGHGHTGLIGGAMTGRLIADLAVGRPPSIDPRPYRVDRF